MPLIPGGRKKKRKFTGIRQVGQKHVPRPLIPVNTVKDRPKRTPKRYPCEKCYVVCKTEFEFRTHSRTHEKEKRYTCSRRKCKKRFKSKIGLDEHERYHGKNVKCEECKIGFPTRYFFYKHLRDIHWARGKMLYACTYCYNTFSLKMALKKHEEIHAAEDRSLPCLECNRRYSKIITVRNHYKKKHPNKAPPRRPLYNELVRFCTFPSKYGSDDIRYFDDPEETFQPGEIYKVSHKRARANESDGDSDMDLPDQGESSTSTSTATSSISQSSKRLKTEKHQEASSNINVDSVVVGELVNDIKPKKLDEPAEPKEPAEPARAWTPFAPPPPPPEDPPPPPPEEQKSPVQQTKARGRARSSRGSGRGRKRKRQSSSKTSSRIVSDDDADGVIDEKTHADPSNIQNSVESIRFVGKLSVHKTFREWSEDDVSVWLKTLPFGDSYVDVFREKNVNGSVLPTISEQMLERVFNMKYAHILKFTRAVRGLISG